MTYTATVRHHSIASHRAIEIDGTLTRAKSVATKAFGAGFIDHAIVILDEAGKVVSSRRIGTTRWLDNR